MTQREQGMLILRNARMHLWQQFDAGELAADVFVGSDGTLHTALMRLKYAPPVWWPQPSA